MMTLTCRICGLPKQAANYADHECPDCMQAGATAMEDEAKANPNASQSDLLYARRVALNERSHHANRDFVDPRDFGAKRGSTPLPPNPGNTPRI